MATTIVAGIFNPINEERLKAGKPRIGLANPVLYQNLGAFHDVTSGDQARGGPTSDTQPTACGNHGFSAVPGWDPVSGLGTIKYPALLKAFMAV